MTVSVLSGLLLFNLDGLNVRGSVARAQDVGTDMGLPDDHN